MDAPTPPPQPRRVRRFGDAVTAHEAHAYDGRVRTSSFAVVLLAVALAACRPPSAVVLVEDPGGLAADADALRVGRSLDDLSAVPLPDALPATVTLTIDETGDRAVFVQAMRGDDVLARTRVDVTFRVEDGTPFVARLAGACAPDNPSTCDDGLFCSGEELCDPVSWSCRAGAPPCEVDAAACAVVQCTEETRSCGAVPDHTACEPLPTESGDVPSYCDVDHGCTATVDCERDADCDDGAFCNGTETCFEGRCVPGIEPVVDDDEPCTDDACDEDNDEIVHTPSLVNALCDGADGAPGVCLTGTCTTSVCGDGVLDTRTGELCDDGNPHDDDLCSAACAPASYAVQRYVGGSLCDGAVLDDAIVPRAFSMTRAPDGALLLVHRELAAVRRVDPTTGVVTRVAGNLLSGADPDGQPALASRLASPVAAAAHADGRVFVREQSPNRIRVVHDGVLRTVAGAPSGGIVTEAADARTAVMDFEGALTVFGDTLVVGQRFWGLVQTVDVPVGGPYPLATILGGGPEVFPLPSGGLGVSFWELQDIAHLADGSLWWTARGELEHHVLRATEDTSGAWTVNAVGGSGDCAESPGFPGDVTALDLCNPEMLAPNALGMDYCFSLEARVVVCVDDGGIASVVAGNSSSNSPAYDVAATASGLGNRVTALVADAQGRLYMAVQDNAQGDLLLRLDSIGGQLQRVGAAGGCGVGGPARDAHLYKPGHVALAPSGELTLSSPGALYRVQAGGDLVAEPIAGDAEHVAWSPAGELAAAAYGRILLVGDDGLGGQKLLTLAGDGDDPADGVDATEARIGRARDLLWLDDDTLVFADEPEQKVRQLSRGVDGAWTVTTLAGSGLPDALAGDGPALTTPLYFPFDLAALPSGGLLVAQRDDPKLRRITPDGQLETVATLPAPVTAIATLPSGTAFVGLATHHIVALVADADGILSVGAVPVAVAGIGTRSWAEGDAREVPLPAPDRLVTNEAGDVFALVSQDLAAVFRLARSTPAP